MKIVTLNFETYHYWHTAKANFLKDLAKVEALTDEELKSKFVIDPWHDGEDATKHHHTFTSFPTIATESQVVDLLLAGFTFEATPGVQVNLEPEVLFNPKVPTGPADHVNHRVEVHMPGQALAMYNETLLMEDACTDALQNELANGWRIIAVCPQPDSRRPDYVLGRYNPNVGVDTEAKRV
jgi:hypothetical protein